MTTITLEPTARGFMGGAFKDRYRQECSIQESSLAEEACIWLGVDKSGRMHLTQEMAAALIPLLQQFVATGELRS
jgi:hypothetical protein